MPVKVSVVVPAFNVQGYINVAIQSVLNQSFNDFEVIVVDDCSTDGTRDEVGKIADERVKLISHEKNLGPAEARNTGVCVANGEWIALLDGDDWWDPGRLETLLSYANAHKLDVVADDLWICETEGFEEIPLWKTRYFGDDSRYLGRLVSPEDVASSMVHAIVPMVRRQWFNSNGVTWKSGIRYAEDFHFLMDVALKGARIQIVPSAGYYYRKNRVGALTGNVVATIQGNIESAKHYQRQLRSDDHMVKILRARTRRFILQYWLAYIFQTAIRSSRLRDKILSLRRRLFFRSRVEARN